MALRQAYYLTEKEADANKCITTLPLAINCTGLERYHAPFCYTTHRYDHSLVYVLCGKMEFRVSGIEISLMAGDFMLLPPSSTITFSTKDSFLEYYWLQFSGSMSLSLIERLGATTLTPHSIGICTDIAQHFDAIFQEFLINDKLFVTACAAKLTDLLVCLFRKRPTAKKELLRSIVYIHKHYNEPLTIQQLAVLEHVSISYYRAQFKAVTGYSPKDYISLQRINAACFYLANTAYPVGQIADLIGLHDPLYFSRFFKQKMGVAPVAYRQNAQAGNAR